MEFSIQKNLFENIISNMQPFLEKKDMSLNTSHILFVCKENTLEIRATDLEIGLLATINDCSIKTEGKATVNGRKILDIVRRLNETDLTIKAEKDILQIKQGKSNFKLQMFDPEEFQEFPKYEDLPKINIDSYKFIQSIKKVIPAIDTNNPKPELNGSLIDIKEYSINFVSTDTRRLAIIKFDNPSVNRLSLIIPRKALIEIQKLFFNDIELFFNETNLIIKSNNYLFFTKLINGKFPDYERIIPKELKYNFILPKDKIVESIKIVTSIANDIKITFNSSNIIFEGISTENNEAITEIEFDTNIKENFSIAMNSKYILDFLSQIDTNEFLFGANESNMPFLLKSDNFLTIVMPIII